MVERPILFSAPMVQAILEGRKTQTRRIAKGLALEWLAPGMFVPAVVSDPANHMCPLGDPGDLLWVRETFAAYGRNLAVNHWVYKATPDPFVSHYQKWTPSIFMPRRASRITLEIVERHIERVQDIDDEDAKAEGVIQLRVDDLNAWKPGYLRARFAALWDSINGPLGHGWNQNDWVWAITFRRLS